MSVQTIPLADFLLARIAEDEAAARAATTSAATEHPGMGWNPAADGKPHSFAAIYGGRVDEAGYRTEEVFRFADEMDCEECVRPSGADMVHIARHDPARVLAECGAKRRIVTEHPEITIWHEGESYGGDVVDEPEWFCGRCVDTSARQPWTDVDRLEFPCLTLRLLALPYADHPDYREEWRP